MKALKKLYFLFLWEVVLPFKGSLNMRKFRKNKEDI